MCGTCKVHAGLSEGTACQRGNETAPMRARENWLQGVSSMLTKNWLCITRALTNGRPPLYVQGKPVPWDGKGILDALSSQSRLWGPALVPHAHAGCLGKRAGHAAHVGAAAAQPGDEGLHLGHDLHRQGPGVHHLAVAVLAVCGRGGVGWVVGKQVGGRHRRVQAARSGQCSGAWHLSGTNPVSRRAGGQAGGGAGTHQTRTAPSRWAPQRSC